MKMRNYLPVHLTACTVDFHKSNMDDIKAVFEDLILSMDDMCDDYQNELETAGRLERLKGHIPTVERDFSNYTMRFYPTMEQLKNSKEAGTSSIFQEEQLKLLKEQNELSKKSLEAASNETLREIDFKKSIAIKKAKTKIEHILSDADALVDEVNKVGSWKDQENIEVSRALRNISNWKKKLDEIINSKRELMGVVAENDICEDDLEIATTEAMVENISSEVKRVTEEIIEEENMRELYTLDSDKVDKVKLPVYEGKDEEDYGKFKEDMEKAFVQNRISKSDKVAKLRECLRGHAKRLIPESITNDIEKAWEALDKAFGKPARLMRFRKAALDKLGSLPKENAKSGVKGHVEWYLELEGLLQSLIDLGRKSDEMYMEAFSPTMLDKICSMFPRNIGCKLSRSRREQTRENGTENL